MSEDLINEFFVSTNLIHTYITLNQYKNQDQVIPRVNHIDFRFRTGSSKGTLFQGRSDNDSEKHIIAALHESR